MESSTKIIVACHREAFASLADAQFLPVHCGKATSSLALGMQGDDTGDNISAQNGDYSELTAHYWAWKNLKGVSYVGLAHYRRHFLFEEVPAREVSPERCMPLSEYVSHPRALFSPEMLAGCDIILPQRCMYEGRNAYAEYSAKISDHDYKLMRRVVIEEYPELYMLLHSVFEGSEAISYKNMFVTRWEIFDAYSEWLFTFMKKFEARETAKKVSGMRRSYGYVTELLINLFVASRGYAVKYCPITYITDI
jgi:hypothetical protein